MRAAHARGFAAAFATIALVAGGLIGAQPAWAAGYAVGTTADGDANSACSNPGVTTTASPVTLRNALCVAANVGGASTIAVPAGTYTLTLGALQFGTQTGTDLTVTGTGHPTIAGTGSEQLLSIDPALVGGISVTLEGLVFDAGADSVFGGGAIIAGSGAASTADELVVRDSQFTDNISTGGSANPGGAIQFMGGSLTIEDSAFSGNDSGLAAGGAVYYEAFGAASGESLSITGSSFSGNSARAHGALANGGGAIAFDTNGHASSVEITDNAFDGNTVTTDDGSPTPGAAIRQVQGPSTITGNSFTGNAAGGAGGAAIDARDGAVTARYNRFAGNTATAVIADASSTVDATRNWWGCTSGPGAAPCDSASGATVTTAPYLTLTGSAAPATIETGQSSTLTASLLVDSAAGAIAPSDLGAFESLAVTWSSAAPAGSSVSSASAPFASGVATTTFTAGSTGGAGGATAGFDGASAAVAVAVRQPASFTSGTAAGAVVGVATSFTVTTSGYPVPTVALDSGTLPAGMTFTANGDGTATLAGTPAVGAEGDYTLHLSAANGGTPALQTLVVSVGSKPVFTGPAQITVAAGTAVDATISASGRPTPGISLTAALPAGLALADQGDGTAKLTGTPTVVPGVYSVPLRASNGNGDAFVSIPLTITTSPGFTSTDHATFTVGSAGAFSVVVDPGVPADAGAVSIVGAAPAWLSLSGAVGAQQLVGTPPVGSGGVYPLTLSVTNSVGTTTQPFTLTVNEGPGYAGSLDLAMRVGIPFDQTLQFSGYPAPVLDAQAGTLPSGIVATGLSDGRVRLSGTPAAGTAGSYSLQLTMLNAAGTLTPTFTIGVGLAPSITSADHTTFTVGQAGAFAFTVDPGYPAPGPVTLDAPGLAWLTLSGPAGAQSLTGTPPAGAGGEYAVDLRVENTTGSAVQHFALTVNEAPAVTTQPLSDSVVAGTAVSFTAAATGFPAPTVQWQRFDGAAWADVAGATSATLAFTAALGDDGARFRAVFTNAAGTATSDEATLAVGTVPAFDGIPAVRVLPGAPRSFDVSVTGSPAPAISVVGALPSWLTFVDNGDGTGTFTGTPTLADVAFTSIQLTATNPYGSANGAISVEVTADVVPPLDPPLPDGVLGGVPAQLHAPQQITVSGSGFLPGAPIVVGMYSQPTTLGSALADGSGAFTATVTVPAGMPLGTHTIVATGVGAEGEARLLAASTELVAPSSQGTSSGASGLSATGFDPLLPMLLAATGVLAGLALLVAVALRRRRRG